MWTGKMAETSRQKQEVTVEVKDDCQLHSLVVPIIPLYDLIADGRNE